MASYLDFEQSIKQIDDDIANARIRGDEHAVEILNKNLEKETAPLMIRNPPIHSVAERKPSTPPMINKIEGSFRSC